MNIFIWRPQYPATLTATPKFDTVQYGDGYSQDAPKGINNNPEVWDLTFGPMARATAVTIRTFLYTQNGQPFQFTNDNGDVKAYKCKSWDFVMADDQTVTMKMKFEEYFGT